MTENADTECKSDTDTISSRLCFNTKMLAIEKAKKTYRIFPDYNETKGSRETGDHNGAPLSAQISPNSLPVPSE